MLALPPGWYTALLLDRTRLIATQVAFFNSTGIKIKLIRLTCDIKLETVRAAKLNEVRTLETKLVRVSTEAATLAQLPGAGKLNVP